LRVRTLHHMYLAHNNKLDALLKSEPALWRGSDQHNEYASIPTGYPQLDNVLPSGGWSVGCLTELLVEQHGIGELSLLLPGLHNVTANHEGNLQGNQWAAFVNPPYLPYAPAFANAGVNLERLLIVNTDNDTDSLWAIEQLLRAGIFAAVVGWVNRTTAQKQRRLQLAAELGKTWATVYRPIRAQQEHSPAAFRITLNTINGTLPDKLSNDQVRDLSNQPHYNRNEYHTDHQHTDTHAHYLSLSIIKSRGGKQRTVSINPSQFDNSQGVEWPAMTETAQTNISAVASRTT